MRRTCWRLLQVMVIVLIKSCHAATGCNQAHCAALVQRALREGTTTPKSCPLHSLTVRHVFGVALQEAFCKPEEASRSLLQRAELLALPRDLPKDDPLFFTLLEGSSMFAFLQYNTRGFNASFFPRRPVIVTRGHKALQICRNTPPAYCWQDTSAIFPTEWITQPDGPKVSHRTVNLKYFFLLLLISHGRSAVFFDLDSCWLRPLALPPAPAADFTISLFVYGRRVNSFRRSRRGTYVTTWPTYVGSIERCRSFTDMHSDNICVNSGLMLARPTKAAMRILAATALVLENHAVFEQNLLGYVLFHATLFGAKVGWWTGNGHAGLTLKKRSRKAPTVCHSSASFCHVKDLKLCERPSQQPIGGDYAITPDLMSDNFRSFLTSCAA